ncbi:MAG TPA: sulfatase-like hydrolase/transferase, partial [Candidatus Methylomirabilis sp.]|nr:sulfatase-like hydrolase/transferase [Candidatus Methylomirabilis sp.]
AVLGLVLVERFASAALIFDGGFSVDVAEQVLPLQPPMRLDGQMSYLSGHSARVDPRRAGAPLPPVSGLREIDPSSVRFTRKPDVLLVLIESLRADFLDPETMPRLWTRARHGAVFERHYAAATSTAHSMFGLLYGLNSYKYQAVLGSGRSPLLLGALQANGYRSHFIAASAVKWIESGSSPVFRNTPGQLESDLVGDGESRDADMLARARRFMTTGGAQPQFLFLFFVGTHFRYSFPPRSARFQPYWDGGGPPRDPARVRARARNAAYEVDWKLDDFLDEYAAARGRKPLVIVTGDHGESLGEGGRFGHGSDVSEAQIHVPMVLLDPSGPPSTWGGVTSHIDIVPTLLALLGDDHPPRSYADGVSMLAPPADRYVLTTVGWEPRHGLVGRDLKATFFGGDAGLLGVALTDPADRSLPDGNARLRAEAARIARTFRDSQAGR